MSLTQSLGNLGDIIFTVSSVKTLTFKDLSHSKSTKYHHHEVIGNKPLTEYIGCDLDKLTFSIELSHQLSVDVREVLEKLNGYANEGTPLEFIVGNSPFGVDKWVIESVSTAYNIVYRNGAIYKATVDLSLEEYISDLALQPNSITNTTSKIKKAIKFYTNVKTVSKTAISGGYNNFVQAEAINTLLNIMK